MAFAPEALKYYAREATARVGGQLSGIVGDPAHTYGYHRSRNEVGSGDYSAQLPLDLLGDGDAASAVDWSLPDDKMKLVTGRLRAAALHPEDDRLDVLREFYGTTDGNNVTGLIHDGYGQAWSEATSDDTHLWHVHHSFFRKHSNDKAAADRVLSVVTGQSWEDYKAHGFNGAPPAPQPTPTPTPTPTPGPSMTFPLPAGEYFGDIDGPNESHGGFYEAERPTIKLIQEKLQALGFAPNVSGWADGLYEQPTIDAVKKFQTANGLSVDGKVGPVTWEKLFPSAKTYTVKPGDTLTKIAKANGTTVAKLVELNNIPDPNKIRVGQVLRLNGSGSLPPVFPPPPPPPTTGGTLKVLPGVNMDSVCNKLKTYLEKSLPADMLAKMYITSGNRGSSGVDYHEDTGSNGAMDFAAPMDDAGQRVMQAAARLVMRDKDLFLEVIHTTPFSDDNGFYVKNGNEVGPGFYGAATEAAHLNHIHLATSETMGSQLISRY